MGHLKAYVKDPLVFLQYYQEQIGDIFTFRVANRRLIFINHPDYLRQILQANHRNYKKSKAYRKLSLLLGDGLFTSDGDYWLSQRRTISPAFHRDQIKDYAQIMQNYSIKLVEKWKDKNELELSAEMTKVTLQIISKTLLDIDLKKEGQLVEKNLPFALKFMVRRITSPLATPLWIPTENNRKFKNTVQKLDGLIYDIIKFKEQNPGKDLLSQLIDLVDEETGSGLTKTQLRDEVMTLFLAGHETSAMAMVWILHHILKDQQLRERVLTEIRTIKDPLLVLQNIFIQNVIKEALRLYTPVWILAREAKGRDFFGPHEIKKGDRIIFSPFLVHRHLDYWENPEVFSPDRFAHELKHKFAYFPFGGGPRVCIGQHFAIMEISILLFNILKHFPDMRLKTNESVGYDYSITLRPDRNIFVEL